MFPPFGIHFNSIDHLCLSETLNGVCDLLEPRMKEKTEKAGNGSSRRPAKVQTIICFSKFAKDIFVKFSSILQYQKTSRVTHNT